MAAADAEAVARVIKEATSKSVKLLAKYELGAHIGAGWRSLVQLVYRKQDGERLACKTSLLEPKDEGDFDAISRRVCTEVECMRRLRRHRGVVVLEDCIAGGPDVWHAILELADCSLADWMKKRRRRGGGEGGGVEERESAIIARCLASTLRDIHAAGIIHRDVKPANILVFQQRRRRPPALKFADFGHAHLLGDGEASGAMGTPRYAAPDMFRGSAYTFPVDVWSLGVTLHQLISGDSRPYPEYGSQDVVEELRSSYGDPRDYFQWDGFPSGAKDLIEQMLDVEPENRPDASAILSHPWIIRHATDVDWSSSPWIPPEEQQDESDEDD